MTNVRAGLAILFVAVVGYTVLQKGAELEAEDEVVRVRLDDVRGIPVGAPVTLAGLQVGTVVAERVGAGYAEAHIRFRKGVDLRSDATLFKTRRSLLSGPSLELDPGNSPERLSSEYLPRVVDTGALGTVLAQISEKLPAVERAAAAGLEQSEDWRAEVNSSFRESIGSWTAKTDELHGRMHEWLDSVNQALKEGPQLTLDAEEAIGARLQTADAASRNAKIFLEDAKVWVTQKARDARQQIEETKVDLTPYSEPIAQIDEGVGVLGTLVNEAELHDDLGVSTREVRDFIDSTNNWQMHLGLRGEWAVRSGAPRSYLTLKAGRPKRYYYLELMTAARGGPPQTSVTYDPGLGGWRRDITIDDTIRVTAQWARRLGNFAFRYGLKESSFGAGADVYLLNDRLELALDVFELSHSTYPRLKMAAAFRVFGEMYLLGGVDDALNPHKTYTIEPILDEVPQTLDSVHIGRDLYLGATVRFDDEDLATLLRAVGGALASLVP